MNKEQRLEKAKQLGLKTQEKYEEIVDEIANIRIDKVSSYGEDRYSMAEGFDFDMLMCFSDIYRKYIRVKKLVKNNSIKGEDGETLREAFKDLANYGIMGIQIYDNYTKEKK